MNIEPIVFYLFSAVLVLASIAVVTVKNTVFAALFLVLAFFTCAAIWILLEAEFLSLVLILVYVGAVMVLFLFVVMMLNVNEAVMKEGFTRYLVPGGLVAIIIVIEMAIVVGPENFGLDKFADPAARGADYSNTKELGMVLYTEYVFPFELAAVLLLIAIIAAISLTMRRRPQTKYQDPSKQIVVRREERVRIVKMESEKMNE